MFGVGENPIFLERQAAREKKRRASGEAQEQQEQKRREALIQSIFVESTDEHLDDLLDN